MQNYKKNKRVSNFGTRLGRMGLVWDKQGVLAGQKRYFRVPL